MSKLPLNQLQEFRRLSGGFRASRVLLTANNYAVFEHLKTPGTAAAIAKKIKTDPRATEILLDAVTALGLLRKSGSRYSNTPLAKTFLVKESPWYQGYMLRHADQLWKSWSGLDEVVGPFQSSGFSALKLGNDLCAEQNNDGYRLDTQQGHH